MPDMSPLSAVVEGLVESWPIPVLVAANAPSWTNNRVFSLNARFTEVFGYTRDDVWDLESWMARAYPDIEDRARFQREGQDALATALKEGRALVRVETQVTCRDGGKRFVEVHAGLHGDKVLVVFNDLTERVRAEHALAESVTFLKQVVDTSPSMIFVVDRNGQIRFVNEYAARYYGTTADALVRDSTANVHRVGVEAEEFVGDDREVIRTRVRLEKDELNTAPNGEKHWFHTVKVPLVRADGTVDVLGISTDITARKRAEAALRESDDKLRLAVSAARIGLWEWDIKQDGIEWDDAMCRIYGVTPEIVPRDWPSYQLCIHPDDRARASEAIDSALRTGVYPTIEHRIVRPDGTIRWIVARATVTRAEDGTFAKFIGGLLDVTEEHEIDERRRESQKLAAIGQLSAGIAHNFNNMLMGILPNLELALPDVTPEVAELLRSARESALRAAELVRQLMTYAGRARIGPKRAVDVVHLVRRTLQICRRTFDRAIELPTEYPDRPQRVVADVVQLEQALLNVLINARDAVIDARVAWPCVRVAIRRLAAGEVELAQHGLGRETPERDYIRVTVSDNGHGMDDATRSRIFEPFFTTKDVGRGTGLGLSTTAAIIREHGGAVHCASSLESGTTFSIYLPSTTAKEAVGEVPLAGVVSEGTETIMIVDDEAAVRRSVKRILENYGYVVRLAASGREALAQLGDPEARSEVALVLLDMSMPDMSGRETRRQLKALAPHLPVAYFTGYALEPPGDADGLIEKPITRDKLLARVREILDRAAR